MTISLAPLSLTPNGPGRVSCAGSHQLDRVNVFADDFETIQHCRGGDDRCPVLVVVKDRNLHSLAQLPLDMEALRRLYVLEIDAAKSRLQSSDDLNKLVGISFANLDIKH